MQSKSLPANLELVGYMVVSYPSGEMEQESILFKLEELEQAMAFCQREEDFRLIAMLRIK